MLHFEELCKSYDGRLVLNGVTYNFRAGAYALAGPNGIGKSTLLRVLAGVVEPNSGTVWIDGVPLEAEPTKAKSMLSYVPDECPVYPFITGRELLNFVAYAKRIALTPQVLGIAERFGLRRHLDTRCGSMSFGTQKKLMLAAAWIGDPAVLLLDEPSNGLDADARTLLVDLLRQKSAEAVVLASTHDRAFVQAINAESISFDGARLSRFST